MRQAAAPRARGGSARRRRPGTQQAPGPRAQRARGARTRRAADEPFAIVLRAVTFGSRSHSHSRPRALTSHLRRVRARREKDGMEKAEGCGTWVPGAAARTHGPARA